MSTFTFSTSGGELTATYPSWQKTAGYTVDLNIFSSRLYQTALGTSSYYFDEEPTTADYYVQCPLNFRETNGGNTSGNGPAIRIDVATGAMYFARYNSVGTRWELYSVNSSGTATLLGSYTQTIASTSAPTMKLEAIGSSIKLYINGTLRISVTNTTVTAKGRGGVRFISQTNAPSTTNKTQIGTTFSRFDIAIGPGAATEGVSDSASASGGIYATGSGAVVEPFVDLASGSGEVQDSDIKGLMEVVQSLSPGTLLEFYELDLEPLGGSKLRWHNGVNELGQDVTWQGVVYTRYPVEAEGFEKSGQGALPRPKLRVANITGLVGLLNSEYEDMVGAKLTRRRTFLRYIDAVNFAEGNPSADPNVGFPDEIWFIDRKASQNSILVEYELSAAFDVSGVQLPRRQCIQNVCLWRYRSAECSYTGPAVADINDQPVTLLEDDVCGKRLNSCRLRFGNYAELPYGGFPGVGLIR